MDYLHLGEIRYEQKLQWYESNGMSAILKHFLIQYRIHYIKKYLNLGLIWKRHP